MHLLRDTKEKLLHQNAFAYDKWLC